MPFSQCPPIPRSGNGGARSAPGYRLEPLEQRQLLSSFLKAQVISYFPDYRFSSLNSIDFSAVSRINYFAIAPTIGGALPTQSSSGFSLTQLQSVVTAAHAASVPVSITIDPGSPFQAIADSPTASSNFINNILSFCTTYHLDGIDLDYEPGALTTTQKNSYGAFLHALHTQTSSRGLLLTAAVQASQMIVPKPNIPDLDEFLLMDYDLQFNSSAPYSDSITYLTNWTNYGVPKPKLFMGVPFYGRAGTSWSNSTTDTYADIVSGYASAHGGAFPPASADSITVGSTTWGINGINTLQQKANYVLANGYGGMMIWELGQDHYTSGRTDASSLLPAIKSILAAPAWFSASSGAGYTFTGTGSTQLLAVSSGTVTFTADPYTTVPTFSVTVTGGSLVFNSSQHLAGLTVSGGAAGFSSAAVSDVLTVNSLNLSGGPFNLGSNGLIVDYSGTTPLSTIRGYLASGFNAGAWNGSGIQSSSAAGDSTHLHAIGYAEASTLGVSNFMGQNVDTTAVLVRYTRYGDNNLDGAVDIGNDFSLLLDGLSGATAAAWVTGDYTFDGRVDLGNDFNLFLRSFISSAPPPPPAPPLQANLSAVAVPAPTIQSLSSPGRSPADFDESFFAPAAAS
jgi:chitinase